jgi:Sortase domain
VVRRFRLVGAFLVAIGLGLLVYGGYTYSRATVEEKQLEALVPGQVDQSAPPVPSFTATETLVTVGPTAMATSEPPKQTYTVIPSRTSTPRSTQTQPAATPTSVNSKVVGPGGLPLGEGADPDRLIIPRLQLDTPVQEATWAVVDENGTAISEWQIPFDAVGHLSTTPKPGEAGNAVISGHQNLVGPDQFGLGKFAGLWNLVAGDEVYIFDNLGRIFLYRVADHYLLREAGMPLSVREANAQRIMKDSDSPIVTFETCWNGVQAPLSGNTYRWVVEATLVGTVKTIHVPIKSN